MAKPKPEAEHIASNRALLEWVMGSGGAPIELRVVSEDNSGQWIGSSITELQSNVESPTLEFRTPGTPVNPALKSRWGREWLAKQLAAAEHELRMGPDGGGWQYNESLRDEVTQGVEFLRALTAIVNAVNARTAE